MAEQITQQLGFDASGAIQGIDRLIAKLGDLNQSLARTQKNLRNFGSGKAVSNVNALSKNLDRAATNMSKLNKSSQTLNNATSRVNTLNNSSKSLVLSWETLSRIAIAQGIVRGVNLIQTEFSEAVRTARDFNLALSEAAAIAPTGIENFQQNVQSLNRELIETSRSFGFDVLDLAEARYQEFSNQVVGSAESNRLFVASNKLARISASEVGESVGALSSVLNSYELSVESSDRVSAALFKTIELGRLRLSDIADQLGNVTPLARDAGIAFEEVFGALTAITRSGVSPSRALTQVRALINQLQKPTSELQKLFTDTFGVQNIEEAIQRFGGLRQVIEAVADAADGNSQQIARFFTNIRARNAFISLSDNSELLAQNIEEIGAAADEGAGFLDNLLKEFDEQDAVKFTKALNNLKLEFLELAQDALPSITFILEKVAAGVGNLDIVLSTLAVAGLAKYSLSMITASTSTEIFTASTLKAQAGVAGLAFAVGFLGTLLARELSNAQIAAQLADDFERLEDVKLEQFAQIDRDTSSAIKSLRELEQQGTASINSLQRAAVVARQSIREENDFFVGSTTATLDRLVSVREKFVQELENKIEGAEQRITQNQDAQSQIREKIADREFERRISGFDEITQATFRQRRAEEALSAARRLPTNQDGLEERLQQLNRAEQLAQEAVRAAEGSGNRTALFRSESVLNDILREQLATKQQQAQLDEAQVAAAEKRRDEEQRRLSELRENVKTLQENLSLFSDGGVLLTEDQRDDAIARAREAFNRIQQDAFSRDDLNFGDLLGLTDLQLKFNQTLNQIDIEAPRQKLQEALTQAAEGQTVKIPVDFILGQAQELGIDTSNFDPLQPLQGIQSIQQEATQLLEENAQLQQRINKDTAEEDRLRGEILARVKQITDLNEKNANLSFGNNAEKIREDTERLNVLLTDLANKRLIQAEDIDNAEKLVNAFNSVGALTDVPGIQFVNEQDTINGLIDSFVALQAQQFETVRNFGELNRAVREEADLTTLQESIREAVSAQQQFLLQSTQLGTYLDAAALNQENLNGSINAGVLNANTLNQSYQDLTTSINQAVSAQQRLNATQSQSSGGSVPRMFGGPLFRAGGGFTPRGTDTIPAMLSPGEFVVNSRSARKFASQLHAMNAGVNPTYRQEGGTVVNNSVNVGDINVNGTSNPDETARRVASQLRREFRRGTASRFNS